MYDLFKKEKDLITRAQAALEKGDLAASELEAEFKALLQAYKKQFKDQKRLMKLNDQNEVALRLAVKKADEASQAKASFLATMSHEIRTPMNGVVGMIDLLHETEMNSDQRHMMKTVRDSAYSLLQIINDILDFSKIEAGKLELELLPVSIGEIIESVAEMLLPAANQKFVRVVCYSDPELPVQVMADAVRIRQILFNLGGNAVKFTENTVNHQGRVIISAEPILSWNGEGDAVRISVSDTGIGLSEKALSSLFMPFIQADSSTSRRFGGTGLGLSICKNLTDLMGGEISAVSQEGHGSTFSITLPLGKVPTELENTEPEHEVVDLTDLSLLTVIKNNDEREFLEKYLSAAGVQVMSTGSLEQAIIQEMEHEEKIDIVVIDFQWSEADISDIRQVFKDRNPRYIALINGRSQIKNSELRDTVFVEDSPLRYQALIRGVAIAAGRLSPDIKVTIESLGPPVRVPPSVEEARISGQLILVAEDNLTNQNVIRRQLNRLGYACEIASDGLEAFDLWGGDTSYAVILSDCHMPEMDGYELTKSIREQEALIGCHVPIVAITANALEGEAAHCLEAGMDDYLTKPLEMVKLANTLEKWMPEPTGELIEETEALAAKASMEPSKVLNIQALTDVFGDDLSVVREILEEFTVPSQDIIADICAAFEQQDSNEIGAAAHKLKSSSRAVGAYELADLCEALEAAGKEADWEMIHVLYPRLAPTMALVNAAIKELSIASD